MNYRVRVLDVIERNNCAGVKKLYVTTDVEGSQVKTVFESCKTWLPPENQLELMMVSPGDEIEIHPSESSSTFFLHNDKPYLLQGEFVKVITEVSDRYQICRCGEGLWSDGFEVYCKDPYCALTVAARLERLGTTTFFDPPRQFDDQTLQLIFPEENGTNTATTFAPILQGKFWGQTTNQLDDILLSMNISPTSAHFLVPDLFEELLTDDYMRFYLSPLNKQKIDSFFGYMTETVNRRDHASAAQNKLIATFLWSLGIESFKPAHIKTMVEYERELGNDDPMIIYIYNLVHPNEMVRELGFHPLEAQTISREIHSRKYELYDIFKYYTLSREDLDQIFAAIK